MSNPTGVRNILKSFQLTNLFLVPNGKFIGPKRVWKRGKDTPGLMMTRTFGDEVGHKCGVIANPGM